MWLYAHRALLSVPPNISLTAPGFSPLSLFQSVAAWGPQEVLEPVDTWLVEDFFFTTPLTAPSSQDLAIHRLILLHDQSELDAATRVLTGLRTNSRLRTLPWFRARHVQSQNPIKHDDVARFIMSQLRELDLLRYLLVDLPSARPTLERLYIRLLPDVQPIERRVLHEPHVADVARYVHWITTGYNAYAEKFSTLLEVVIYSAHNIRLSLAGFKLVNDSTAVESKRDDNEQARDIHKLMHDRHATILNVVRTILSILALMVALRIILPLSQE